MSSIMIAILILKCTGNCWVYWRSSNIEASYARTMFLSKTNPVNRENGKSAQNNLVVKASITDLFQSSNQGQVVYSIASLHPRNKNNSL
jgi:hypothetical protein